MTIRTKLRLGALVVLALFAGLCGFAALRMSAMLEESARLTDLVIPSLELSIEISATLGELRATEVLHVLEQDDERMKVLQKDIEAKQAHMRELLARFGPLVASGGQDKELSVLKADFDFYVAQFQELLKVSQENRTDEAISDLRASAPTHADLRGRLTELDRSTRTLADDARHAEDEVARRTQRDMMIALALLAATLIAGAILFSRGVLIPVRQMIGAIDRLAANDLAPEVPMASRRDELGEVARALVLFRGHAIERERLQKQERDDLDFARHIQLSSVPSVFPAFPNRREFDVCGHLSPMRAIGGDFFDFYFTDDRHLALVIGDASGKGVPSALFVSTARGILKAENLKGAGPAQCLTETNRNIVDGNDAQMFITTFLAVLDTSTGTLVYANAGHLPPYLLRGNGTIGTLPVEPGLPLGVVDEFAFRTESIQLTPGDTIVLYTDGVTEAATRDDVLFGDQRLADLLGGSRWQNCHEIVEGVMSGVRLYEAGAPQSDDVAVLALRYLGS